MPNYGAKILNSAISGLSAQQAVIAATANNIANVNTPGYSRRVMNLQTRNVQGNSSDVNVGDGVDVAGITRMVNTFIEKVLKESQSDQASYEVQSDMLGRVEALFSLDGSSINVGSAMNAFFKAINDLTSDPSSIQLRSTVLQAAQDVVSTIQTTYSTIANLQLECDQQVESEVATVNSLTAQIAELNGRIASRESGTGNIAADERDRRETLLNDLSKKIGIKTIELADGSVSVTLPGGFSLVSGTTSRNLEVTHTPSFSPGNLPASLSGGTLSYVVYDYDPGVGTAHVDLTQDLMTNGGTIGGLLTVRGYADPTAGGVAMSAFQATGPLVEIASCVEAVTRMLLTTVNESYLGPDEAPGTAGHQPSSGDLSGNPPDIYGLFDFEYSGVKDVNGNGLPDDLDICGPGGTGLPNYSSILKLSFTDPSRLAAALDLDPSTQLSKSFATGDGRNMETLAALQTDTTLSFSCGSFAMTGTFDNVYSSTVVKVSNLSSSAQANEKTSVLRTSAVQSQRDEVSGVSLDEEFSNLIRFQRAYQASGRLIRLADQLLEQLVSMI